MTAVAAVESLTILPLADLRQQVLDLLFDGQQLIHHHLRLAAGLAQQLLAPSQGAHRAWRKSGRSGYSHTALGAACGIMDLFWRVRPVVWPTHCQLAAW